jgi:hypothetical protein
MIECIFGWGKQHGTMRKTKHRGITKVTTDFMLNLIAYNLIRISELLTAQPTALTTTRSPHELEDKGTEKALLSRFFSGLLECFVCGFDQRPCKPLAAFGQSCRTMSEIYDYREYPVACEVCNSDT